MLHINFKPFPELAGSRLHLRRITADDAPVVLALRSNPQVMQYIPRPLHTNLQQALDYIERIDTKTAAGEWINWAITLKGEGPMIGVAGLFKIQPEHHRCEVGYMLLPESAGRGLSTEATPLVLEFAFEQLQMHSAEAVIDPGNIASERVLQKNGFVKEAHLKENFLYNGEYLDTVIYSLLRKNYRK